MKTPSPSKQAVPVVRTAAIKRTRPVTRRSFLATSSVAVVGLGLSSGVGHTHQHLMSERLQALSPDTMKTLLQMARDIFPHEKFPDTFYQEAIQSYDSAAVENEELKNLLEEGVKNLNEVTNETVCGLYTSVRSQASRLSVLEKIKDTSFFQKIRGDLVVSLYNQAQVWNALGYEGPSADKGGYLYRGFDDIDWL